MVRVDWENAVFIEKNPLLGAAKCPKEPILPSFSRCETEQNGNNLALIRCALAGQPATCCFRGKKSVYRPRPIGQLLGAGLGVMDPDSVFRGLYHSTDAICPSVFIGLSGLKFHRWPLTSDSEVPRLSRR